MKQTLVVVTLMAALVGGFFAPGWAREFASIHTNGETVQEPVESQIYRVLLVRLNDGRVLEVLRRDQGDRSDLFIMLHRPDSVAVAVVPW